MRNGRVEEFGKQKNEKIDVFYFKIIEKARKKKRYILIWIFPGLSLDKDMIVAVVVIAI